MTFMEPGLSKVEGKYEAQLKRNDFLRSRPLLFSDQAVQVCEQKKHHQRKMAQIKKNN